MSESSFLREQIFTDFEGSIQESESVPQDIADLFSGNHGTETFGDDDKLLLKIKESLRDDGDQ